MDQNNNMPNNLGGNYETPVGGTPQGDYNQYTQPNTNETQQFTDAQPFTNA